MYVCVECKSSLLGDPGDAVEEAEPGDDEPIRKSMLLKDFIGSDQWLQCCREKAEQAEDFGGKSVQLSQEQTVFSLPL
jgi:hypothetical protein